MKFTRFPSQLTEAPFFQRGLKLNGFSVVEACIHAKCSKGSMFLEEHLLMYVMQGKNILTHGKISYIVRANEMILLPKATLVQFDKTGDPLQNHAYDSILFFLKDEFLKEFVRIANVKNPMSKEIVRVAVKPVKERMERFFESIIPYFNEPADIDPGLLRIKMLELLFDISATDKNLLQQLLQIKSPVKSDLAEIIEANFSNPVNIGQLAYLSGRSLATFKRDFNKMYNMPPSEWIRIKRLVKAKEALENTNISISDICYMLGFESPSHFSRIFKSYFGHNPGFTRQVKLISEPNRSVN